VAEVVQFVSKSELERARLIREARAIYESIFPPAEKPVTEPREQDDTPNLDILPTSEGTKV